MPARLALAAIFVLSAAAVAAPTEQERREAMYRAQGEFEREKARVSGFRRTEPARYAAELRPVLERWEAELAKFPDVTQSVGARQSLGREYLELGALLRFELRRPDAAIAAYEGARRAQPQGFDIAALSIADTYRFDRNDMRAAIDYYRRAAASVASVAPGQEAQLAAGLKQWLEHELAYLERGRRFSGAIGRADMGTGQLWLLFGAMQAPLEPPPDARALARLAPSQLQIARAFPAVLELEPKEMLAFFARHDPAGYLTAAILAAANARDPSPYVKAAAQTYFRERGIRGGIAGPADPRYATPEKTWTAFIGATKKGDAAAMLDCFTPEMQAKLAELFKRLSADERRRMGESFVGFALQGGSGEFREAMVVRQQQDRKTAGFIHFVNDGGAWKIAEM